MNFIFMSKLLYTIFHSPLKLNKFTYLDIKKLHLNQWWSHKLYINGYYLFLINSGYVPTISAIASSFSYNISPFSQDTIKRHPKLYFYFQIH